VKQTDMPSTSAAAARIQPVEIERNEQVTNDDNRYLIIFYEQDTNCLSVDYDECKHNGDMTPSWLTDTVISTIFIIKILAEHSKRINHDNILLVNHLIWRDMARANKSKRTKFATKNLSVESTRSDIHRFGQSN
jgi:hypothetical protein